MKSELIPCAACGDVVKRATPATTFITIPEMERKDFCSPECIPTFWKRQRELERDAYLSDQYKRQRDDEACE